MNKTAGYILFLLAGIGLLAHAVICHHHLNDTQLIAQCDHTPCHGSYDNCSLETLYAKWEKEKHSTPSHHSAWNLLPDIFILCSDYTLSLITDEVALPFRQNPCLLSCHTKYISQSLGLRAPPVEL